jgi:hypothetical protein
MIWWGRKINDDYAWELCAFHKYRDFSDGVDIFKFNLNWDRYLADHTPRFEFMFIILNFVVCEFNIYYIWHRDNLDESDTPNEHVCTTNPPSLIQADSCPTQEP